MLGFFQMLLIYRLLSLVWSFGAKRVCASIESHPKLLGFDCVFMSASTSENIIITRVCDQGNLAIHLSFSYFGCTSNGYKLSCWIYSLDLSSQVSMDDPRCFSPLKRMVHVYRSFALFLLWNEPNTPCPMFRDWLQEILDMMVVIFGCAIFFY